MCFELLKIKVFQAFNHFIIHLKGESKRLKKSYRSMARVRVTVVVKKITNKNI